MLVCGQIKRRIIHLILYIIFLFATSMVPMDQRVEGFRFVFAIRPTVQNLLHIPLFTALSILWLRALQSYGRAAWESVFLTLLLSSFVGVLNEFIQIVVPGRYPSLVDTIMNVLGSILGIVLYQVVRNEQQSQRLKRFERMK